MRYIFVLLLGLEAAFGQTVSASIAGVVLDAITQKPVSSALVIANRSGLPPLAKNTRSGGAGEFQIQGLAAGTYSLCVQVAGDRYLDPCQWNGSPVTVTVTAGQAATGISVKLAAAST